MKKASDILQQYWHYDAFRGEQAAIIEAVLSQKNVLALLPTGGGKSICFQVPAMVMDGLCLVISPLIALMNDQVENLKKRGIAAATINSTLSFKEVEFILNNATTGIYKFLYVSPERLESRIFLAYLPQLSINLIAVDEAHCISQWGYDFRPSYLRIQSIKKQLPKIPIIALTASATPIVQTDIIEKLQLHDVAIFKQSFEKPNLSFSSIFAESKINKLVNILQKVKGSSIVYCNSRKHTKEVAVMLQQSGILADYYHAGLLQEERTMKQHHWIEDKIRVIVCTNAFGMGIDKPNVRTVIHYDVPDCLENYYQEAGRAGRDGQLAFAVLLYNSMDIASLQELPNIRFPSIATIQQVYQSLADFLQIPVGIGEGIYYEFDVFTFIKNFKLDLILTINTLKVLEQEGLLFFTESVFIPSKIQFTTDKNTLEYFEKNYPQFDPIIKCLLRSYTGIFDHLTTVFERQIAKSLKTDVQVVKDQLLQLSSLKIIEYIPQKDTPQIYFATNRAAAKYLHIHQENYFARRKAFEQRVNAMLEYIRLNNDCRSVLLASYFGDNQVKNCGICDNCLAKKKTPLNPEEILQLEHLIVDIVSKFPHIYLEELLEKIVCFTKEKKWRVIQLLEEEKKIIIGINQQVQILSS